MVMMRRDTAAKSGGRMRESSHTLDKRMSGWPPTAIRHVRMLLEGEKGGVSLYGYLRRLVYGRRQVTEGRAGYTHVGATRWLVAEEEARERGSCDPVLM